MWILKGERKICACLICKPVQRCENQNGLGVNVFLGEGTERGKQRTKPTRGVSFFPSPFHTFPRKVEGLVAEGRGKIRCEMDA